MDSCIFCKIINKEFPASILYEDNKTITILDLHPVHIGHALVIPKDHHENVYSIPDDVFAHVSIVAKKMAGAIKKSVRADGINIIMNNESAAGQIVMHAHIHIVPRYENDGFVHWTGLRGYQDGEMESLKEKIIENL